jgi:hypothetical protein
MRNINQKLKWLLMVLPLTGCASSVPLDTPNTKVISVSTKTSVNAPMQAVKQEVNNSNVLVVENNQKTELNSDSSTVAIPNPLDRPGDPTALSQQKNVVSRPVNIDPNVKLISPPTVLPKTSYVVPQVEEKENYVPPVASKVTTCTKGKHGKKICKTSVKTEGKAKKESSGKDSKTLDKKSSKSSSKKSNESLTKKAVEKTHKKSKKH